MFKISVQDEQMIHTADYSQKDTPDCPYYPSVEEAVDAAMSLLSCVYGRREVAMCLKEGLPAEDYANDDSE